MIATGHATHCACSCRIRRMHHQPRGHQGKRCGTLQLGLIFIRLRTFAEISKRTLLHFDWPPSKDLLCRGLPHSSLLMVVAVLMLLKLCAERT